jgi:gliding motility-associated-like protein
MKRLSLLCTLFCCVFTGVKTYSQDFSNKGKDFWVGYGYHQIMTGGGNVQEMVLYFATDAVTTVTVSIPGIGYNQVYNNIPANTVFTSAPIPKFAGQDARLTTETGFAENKGIHITSDRPIVAYAHIYNASVSGATILFPTNTLGKEYYSINYDNISNTSNANCWFYVVACDTGTTTVEITPSGNTLTRPAGAPFTVNLTQGQVYNVMGQLITTSNPFRGVDLTGSKIQSIDVGNGCKRIGVFSGSGRISITCNGGSSSSDNYMVQAFPKSAWGKKFLTAPAGGPGPNNFFRICVSDPATVVLLNGAVITAPLINNFYYQVGPTQTPNLIEADKPITVAQYLTSQGACGNGSPGDPETIYLSPVEQNINRVLWNATGNFAIQQHYVNAIIPNAGTAISSFRLDGAIVSPILFIPHPQTPAYSYVQLAVTPGQHTIQSDSGFNAIAYGYGSAESYGYNAGTNIKDLFQFITIRNQHATVSFPAACKNSPFFFSMVFPYQPTSIQWKFNGIFPDVSIPAPVFDSSWVLAGRTLYRYRLPTPYNIAAVGTYPIRVIANSPTPDGCGGEQEIDFDLQVFDNPVAEFNFATNGCLTSPVTFTDNPQNTQSRPVINWYWNFGDGNTASAANSSHIYSAPGVYNVRHVIITDVGCVSDTLIHPVSLSNPPVALFTPGIPRCAGRPVTFTDASAVPAGNVLDKWYWDFGDGNTILATTNAAQTHTYAAAGNYTVTLRVETTSGCQSLLFSLPVTINVNPLASFNFPNICLPVGAAQFANTSAISDGTGPQMTYLWNFGDATTSTQTNPLHNYAGTGPYTVTLAATSNNGCTDDSVRIVNTIYAEPQAGFGAPIELCLGTVANFIDVSTAANAAITSWTWNFGDGNTSALQNPSHTYTAPGTYNVSLGVGTNAGCQSVNIAIAPVTVNPLPTANFNTAAPVCETRDLLFTDQSAPNAGNLVTWRWNFGDGNNSVLSSPAPFTHNYTAAGTYPVTLRVETNKGCISTILSRNIIVNNRPGAGYIAPEICLTDPFAPFLDTSSIAAGSITGWDWNFGDPNANAGNPNTSVLQNPLHRYTVTGPYTTTLVVTSASGCKDTVAQTFIVNGSIPLAGYTVNNPTILCSNNTVTINDASSVDFGSIVKVEIFWDYANDPTIKTTDDLPTAGKQYTHTYPEFGTPFTRTYTVRYVAYSGINCINTTARTITVLATPSVQFNAVSPVCDNVPAFPVTQASITNGLPGTGLFTGAGISATGVFNPAIAGAGIHNITYTYTGTNGCINAVSQPIEVYPSPRANAGPDKTVLEGGVAALTPALFAGIPVTYLWTPSTYLSNPNIPGALVQTPVDDITYTLRVTSNQGCFSTDDVFIKVLKAPVVPNAFSPNGDGIHDEWQITYLETYPGCVIDVYNRYGQLVYHTINYSTAWNGKINGRDAPVGTYYYIIDPKNGRKPMTGFVDIIR